MSWSKPGIAGHAEQLLDLCTDLLAVSDAACSRWMLVNRVFTQTLGWPEQELTSRSIGEFVAIDDRQHFADVVSQLQDAAEFEQQMLCEDRSFRSIHWRIVKSSDNALAYWSGRDVTAQRAAEAALREQKARLRAILDTTRVYIGLLSPDGTVLEASRASLSFDPEHSRNTIGSPYPDTLWFAHTEGAPDVVRREIAQAQAGNSVRYETALQRADGETVRFDFSLKPVFDDTGGIAYLLPEAIEINERKRAEAALKASEERFRGFAEATSDTLWIADEAGQRLDYVSPAFEHMFGESREAIMADLSRWRDLIHPDDLAAASELMPRTLATGSAIGHYRVVRPSDGRTVCLRDSGFLIRGKDRRVTHVAGIVQDVTDIETATQALRKSELRFRTLAERIPQLVWQSCPDGMWNWASPQWLAYTGQRQEDCRGLGWLAAVHPEDQKAAVEAWKDSETLGLVDVEFRVKRAADDTWRWHQTRAVPVRGATDRGCGDGPILEWLGTTTDVDDLKRLQGQQSVLLDELQHRGRNMLALLRVIAMRSLPPSPERDEYDARLAALGRLQGFLSRTQDWAVSLRDLVDAELHATGDHAATRIHIEGPALELPGDKTQAIALALHELATNAAKYGAFAQPDGRLSVTWSEAVRADGSVWLTIDWRETGLAMPPGPPSRRGYGSELIERALPYQLNAETSLRFLPDGVHCTVALPIDAAMSQQND